MDEPRLPEAPDPAKLPPIRTKYVINDREVDIAPVIPFKGITWRALRKIRVDPMQLQKMARTDSLDMESLEKIAFMAFRLVDPTITDDDVLNALTFSEISNAAAAVLRSEVASDMDRPTSTPSLPSPSDGDGGLPTSTS